MKDKISFFGSSVSKKSSCIAGEAGSIPQSLSLEGNGNPLQYSCLGNTWTEEPGGYSPCSQKNQTGLKD